MRSAALAHGPGENRRSPSSSPARATESLTLPASLAQERKRSWGSLAAPHSHAWPMLSRPQHGEVRRHTSDGSHAMPRQAARSVRVHHTTLYAPPSGAAGGNGRVWHTAARPCRIGCCWLSNLRECRARVPHPPSAPRSRGPCAAHDPFRCQSCICEASKVCRACVSRWPPPTNGRARNERRAGPRAVAQPQAPHRGYASTINFEPPSSLLASRMGRGQCKASPCGPKGGGSG